MLQNFFLLSIRTIFETIFSQVFPIKYLSSKHTRKSQIDLFGKPSPFLIITYQDCILYSAPLRLQSSSRLTMDWKIFCSIRVRPYLIFRKYMHIEFPYFLNSFECFFTKLFFLKRVPYYSFLMKRYCSSSPFTSVLSRLG